MCFRIFPRMWMSGCALLAISRDCDDFLLHCGFCGQVGTCKILNQSPDCSHLSLHVTWCGLQMASRYGNRTALQYCAKLLMNPFPDPLVSNKYQLWILHWDGEGQLQCHFSKLSIHCYDLNVVVHFCTDDDYDLFCTNNNVKLSMYHALHNY